MIVIGVTGFRRSGKNLTTEALERHFGFKHFAFADALRQMCVAVNPVISLEGAPERVMTMLSGTIGRLHGQQKKEWRYNELIDELSYNRAKDIPDFRGFLQKLGTEGVRNTFGPNAWVNALDRAVAGLPADARVAISDVRFGSEAEWVHSVGGVLWRVDRPGVGGDDPHASEIEIPLLPADAELHNNSTLEAFERAVIDAAEHFLPLLPRSTSTKQFAHDSSGSRSGAVSS